MPFIAYTETDFKPASLHIIAQARAICEEYTAAGYGLTLRQLYYQFVARGYIANKQTEYKRLGSIVNDARMAGLLDWNWISDRTRNVSSRGSWTHPRDIIRASAQQFHLNYWAEQPFYVEVWVEKEALAGVVEQTCYPLDVPTLACRGYMSQSEQWSAGQRFAAAIERGKMVRVIHLGDHDPSGIDMTRDNTDRLTTFVVHNLDESLNLDLDLNPPDLNDVWYYVGEAIGDAHDEPLFQVERIALNMDQIRAYNPPPNPAKITDSRFTDYEARFGSESWELDALPPDVLDALVSDAILQYTDVDVLDRTHTREQGYRSNVQALLDEHGHVLDRALT